MAELERKTYSVSPELKADSEGAVRALFSTFNVIDKQGDITLPGAFGQQDVRIQPHGHDMWLPTIGKGAVSEEAAGAIFEGLFNLGMDMGRETWASLKFDTEHGTPLQEWSYIFDVLDSEMGQQEGQDVRFLKKLKVYSVDPVFLGAGIGTRTVAVKSDDLARRVLAMLSLKDDATDDDIRQACKAVSDAELERKRNTPESLFRSEELRLARLR